MNLFALLFIGIYCRESWAIQKGEPAFLEFVTNHCVEDGISYIGTELEALANIQPEVCHEACQVNPWCDHASYTISTNQCSLKANNTGRTENPDFLSIPKHCIPNCSIEAADFWGNDVGNVNDVPSLEECQIHCRANPDCIGAAWTKPWAIGLSPNGCWMKRLFRLGEEMYLGRSVAILRFCPDAMIQPNGWYQYQNKYYKFIALNNTFESASEACRDMEAQLVTVDSREEYLFIRSMAFALSHHSPDEFHGSFRLGLYKNNSKWTWSNGTTVGLSEDFFWCSSQPDNIETEVHAKFWEGDGFCVIDDVPSMEENFICATPTCDPPSMKNAQLQTSDSTDLIKRYFVWYLGIQLESVRVCVRVNTS
ncbi:uncharacterized protein LOC131878228 isoform X2 [Tigriopus californicus]|uniref:uncharacterized protein LOC131878228 isoform X2 n=1 Tax=Tigriopus californicus TaxID=6832 RepID=UPI0027D9D75B|nr:uncharacterized protein LOC131878228 isoform X2 [Tigriopus californicus]